MSKTIAAISTGNAPGGIGVIRISGDDAIDVADKVFLSADKKKLGDLDGYTAKFGNILSNGEKIDNAVALVFRAPKSYTGENGDEVSVHGGLLGVDKTLQEVLKAGANMAEAGEFTKRAFLNGKMDLTQAEGVLDIISAQGEASLKASFNALEGNLSNKINGVLDKLLDISSLMGAWVDYPDEEIEELSYDELTKTLENSANELKDLLNNYDNAQTITRGITTAIVGRTNAGKSSLMNVLCGKDKSIVTQIEGTTRDVVEQSVVVNGIVLHLLDTAGLRESDDEVENIGIKKTHKAIDSASLILAVFDGAKALSNDDFELIEKTKNKNAIAIINKTDLDEVCDENLIKNSFENVVKISAKNETGFDEFRSTIQKVLGVSNFDSSAPMLANIRQKNNCQKAHDCLISALNDAKSGVTFDAVNVMIDSAVNELLSLTGRAATIEVVNNIFSKFCVGK